MTEALAEAKAKENINLCGRNSNTLAQLYGLPVSVKDCVNVKERDSTLGLVSACGKGVGVNVNDSVEDSLLVELLRAAGAIPFVKTNVPQTMISFECRNPLWGTTTNPWNTNYTPGTGY